MHCKYCTLYYTQVRHIEIGQQGVGGNQRFQE